MQKNIMQKNLDLTIRLNRDDFEVDVYEPESGDVKQMQFPYSFDEHPEFDAQMGQEIYSWISLWADEFLEEDENSSEEESPSPELAHLGIMNDNTRTTRFDELCKDFDKRRPAEPPIKKTYWFTAEWENGNDSCNDILRQFLKEHGYEYVNTINGDVWFLYNENWSRCEYEVSGDIVRVYLCEFVDN